MPNLPVPAPPVESPILVWADAPGGEPLEVSASIQLGRLSARLQAPTVTVDVGRLLPRGDRNLLAVRWVSEASELAHLRFPAGRPARGETYLQHPFKPDCYYPARDFHRLMLDEKVAEAFDLMRALGATGIEVEGTRASSRSTFGALRGILPLKQVPSVGADGANLKRQAQLSQLASSLVGSSWPQLHRAPCWYDHEPTWQALARSRLDADATSGLLKLAYVQDIAFDGRVDATLANFGLKASAGYKKSTSVAWEIKVVFGVPRGPLFKLYRWVSRLTSERA